MREPVSPGVVTPHARRCKNWPRNTQDRLLVWSSSEVRAVFQLTRMRPESKIVGSKVESIFFYKKTSGTLTCTVVRGWSQATTGTSHQTAIHQRQNYNSSMFIGRASDGDAVKTCHHGLHFGRFRTPFGNMGLRRLMKSNTGIRRHKLFFSCRWHSSGSTFPKFGVDHSSQFVYNERNARCGATLKNGAQ